jgi:uncharacterized membrane protein
VRAVSRSQRLLSVFWIAAGVNHFVNPRAYEAIMPDYVPAQREAVFWSGVAEVIGGLAVIPGRTRRLARWWILGVLVAVFPANVHMALHPERYRNIPEPALWARLPVQLLLAWWAWRATAPGAEPRA